MFKLLRGKPNISQRYIGLSPGIMWIEHPTFLVFYLERSLLNPFFETMRQKPFQVHRHTSTMNDLLESNPNCTIAIYSAQSYGSLSIFNRYNREIPMDEYMEIRAAIINLNE